MKAKIQVYTLFAKCPECNDLLIDNKTGDTMIPVFYYKPDTLFTCRQCNKSFQLPETIWEKTQ